MQRFRWRSFLVIIGVVGTLFAAKSVGMASDDVLRALSDRGLAPAPDVFLSETTVRWNLRGDIALADERLAIRLPRANQSGLVLVGGPNGAVIVDQVSKQGPLAISPATANALGLKNGTETVVQIIALRKQVFAPDGRAVRPLADRNRLDVPVRRSGAGLILALPEESAQGSQQSTQRAGASAAPSSQAIAPAQSNKEAILTEPKPQPPPALQEIVIAALSVQTGEEPAIVRPKAQATPSVPASAATAATAAAQPKPGKSAKEGGAPKSTPEQPQSARSAAFLEPAGEPRRTPALALLAGDFYAKRDADLMVDLLRANDLPAEVRRADVSSDKLRWLVVLGPFADDNARRAARVRGDEMLNGAVDLEY